MVGSVGNGTSRGMSPGTSLVQSSVPSMQQASVSDDDGAQQSTQTAVQPGVTVRISPEGAAASASAQGDEDAGSANASDDATASSDANTANASDTSEATGNDTVSPVKAFAYGALGLERPDEPHDQRNAFYTAGKWLAAGITIGGLISLLA
jgi:hypothetical protein